MVGQSTVERLAGIRWAERVLGKESPGGEELASQLQATVFPSAVAGSGKNQRLPQRVELPAMGFLPVAAELKVD